MRRAMVLAAVALAAMAGRGAMQSGGDDAQRRRLVGQADY